MRFTKSGAANGLYLIYDFYPPDDLGNRDERIDTDCWGCLPDDPDSQQFSMARFADTITELRPGRSFQLMEVVDHLVELVVQTSDGAIIRVTVAE